MIELRDKQTGRVLGCISEDQFKFLVDQLEEESNTDDDYYLNAATLDLFVENGIDPQLLTILREALGDRAEMDIKWSRT